VVNPASSVLPAALGLALAGSLTASLAGAVPALGTSPAGAVRAAAAGAPGLGDPYFPQDGNGGIDVLHYEIRDSYSFGSGRLVGRTRLDVRATQDLSRFNLDFVLDVSSVRIDGRKATFRQGGGHELRITPAAPLPAGRHFRVVVRYAGVPAAEGSRGERNWLADGSEVVTMNEPHMAAWWFPANDHPRDKASFDIHITVPKGKDVIANGVLVRKRTREGRTTAHWRAVEPMATYLAFFAAGSFAVSRSRCLGLPNIFAVSRNAGRNAPSKVARSWARETCAILTSLSGVLGPYPFASTGGLATSLPVSFALENQTRPTYPHLAVQPGLLAHELAHQWFGDSVSVANWRDIWVNEGFAQYLQTYYLTEVEKGRSMQAWLTETYNQLAADQEFWRLPIGDPGPERLFDGAVYVRGAMAVQALRHRLGDQAFWALLRTWVGQRRYGNGSVADFEALAASVSGQDLTAFFDTWLHVKAAPAPTAENGF
jgi:aminopeptidase N